MDKPDGSWLSVPTLMVDNGTADNGQRHAADCQSSVDWLKHSGAPLLADVADRLLASGPIDKAALQWHLPSRAHWQVVLRHIEAIERDRQDAAASAADPAAAAVASRNSSSSRSSSWKLSQELREVTVSDGGGSHGNGAAGQASPGGSGLDAYPDFCLSDNPLGHAYVEDFSPEDWARLRALAHLELAAQFEKCGGLRPVFQLPPPPRPASPLPSPVPPASPSWRRKGGRKSSSSSRGGSESGGGSGSGWFGVPLETVLESERKLGLLPDFPQVPQLITALVNRLNQCGVEEEGIFRVSGSVQTIRQLRARIESHGPGGAELASADPNDAAGLLKAFLRDLPQPLLCGPYVDYYRALDSLQTLRQRLIGINLLVVMLPTSACCTLRAVIYLLGRVLDHHEKNRMTLRALATVMTPSLLPAELTSTLGDSERVANIVEMLIKYRSIVWRVPETLVRQLRATGSGSNCALFTGLGGLEQPRDRVTSGGDIADPAGLPPAKVTLVVNGGPPQTVTLQADTTATDVLNLVHSSTQVTEDRLYEVGGNIKERRLPGTTRLRQLLAANPGLSLAIM